MQIRKFCEKDFNELRRLCAICFNITNDRTDEEELQIIKNDKTLRGRSYFNRYVALNDEGNITSTIGLIPYNASFDNHTVKVTGIRAVASLPQYRNKGAVRECFSKAFSEMYNDGCAFSYLYPFSSVYYRKFGYGLACDLNDFEIKIHRISPCNTKGSYELISGDASGLKTVYNEMCKRFSMLVKRENDDWTSYEEKDYLKDNSYTYLYRDENGVPKSFFTYKREADGWDNIMNMSENVYFYDKEGFGAILDFAVKLKGNFHTLKMSVPADARIDTVISEQAYSAISKTNRINGMARCINLEKVLENASFHGSGKVIIKINDEMIPENDGVWSIEFKNDSLVSFDKTDEKPQVKMAIDIFTSLILGRYDVNDIEYISGIEVYSTNKDLGKIFYKKKIAIYDHY